MHKSTLLSWHGAQPKCESARGCFSKAWNLNCAGCIWDRYSCKIYSQSGFSKQVCQKQFTQNKIRPSHGQFTKRWTFSLKGFVWKPTSPSIPKVNYLLAGEKQEKNKEDKEKQRVKKGVNRGSVDWIGSTTKKRGFCFSAGKRSKVHFGEPSLFFCFLNKCTANYRNRQILFNWFAFLQMLFDSPARTNSLRLCCYLARTPVFVQNCTLQRFACWFLGRKQNKPFGFLQSQIKVKKKRMHKDKVVQKNLFNFTFNMSALNTSSVVFNEKFPLTYFQKCNTGLQVHVASHETSITLNPHSFWAPVIK